MTFLSPTWTLTGYDAAAHVAEETSNAAVNVPRAMIWATWSSAAMGWVYLISLALCSIDIDSLMLDPLGQPIGTLLNQVLGTKAAVGFLVIHFIAQFACGVAFVRITLAQTTILKFHSIVRGGESYLLRLFTRQGAPILGLAI